LDNSNVRELQLKKFTREEATEVSDIVAAEIPFTIFFNHQEIVTLLCTPSYLKELGVGFLQSEGFIKNKNDILFIHLDDQRGSINVITEGESKIALNTLGKRAVTSGCGKGTIFYNVIDSLYCKDNQIEMYLEPQQIYKLMHTLQHGANLFLETGGTHSAALSDGNEMIILREDIGRHNAIDKIFGECLLNDSDLSEKVILTSGRISSEIVIKLAKRSVPIVISCSAPTGLAVELAQKTGITLIGFTRGEKMNVYTNDWRIKT